MCAPCVGILRRTFRPASTGILSARALSIKIHLLPTAPPLDRLTNREDTDAARGWIEKFEKAVILREHVELSFSRSSGPGGQNVNKVNTKASLRCFLSSPWIPAWARDRIRESPHYVSSSQTILVTSTVHRSQARNVDDCLAKLHALILSSASKDITNEPSEEQRRRVKRFEALDKARRKKEKDRRSEVKRSRSSKNSGWD
ncbi:RF-1 domain-containing protein [Amylostereum chailletii]|nr:RF-1 domain-containing protein [Amylostereum chailletii]